MAKNQTNSDFLHAHEPLTLGPEGKLITINNIPLPESPPSCTREHLKAPICRYKSGAKNTKSCETCEKHAVVRKKYIKSQRGLKAINLIRIESLKRRKLEWI
jgi:hypothetical protein